jgi:hypothetical protein
MEQRGFSILEAAVAIALLDRHRGRDRACRSNEAVSVHSGADMHQRLGPPVRSTTIW